MKTYTVTTTSMGQHVTDRSYMNMTFNNFDSAQLYFRALCAARNIDCGEWVEKEQPLSAGGIGHDYRVELEISQ